MKTTSASRAAPKYIALSDSLHRTIDAEMAPHQALHTERDLMREHGVSRMTVRQALGRLEEAGVIYRVQGSGTYVAERPTVSKNQSLTSFSEDITARGMTPGSRAVDAVEALADGETAAALQLSPGAAVWHITRVRTADAVPMCLEEVWIPMSILGRSFQFAADLSLYQALVDCGAAPHQAEQVLRASVLSPQQAALLEVPSFSPVLEVSRVTADARGRRVERGVSRYRADRYDFRLNLQRDRKSL